MIFKLVGRLCAIALAATTWVVSSTNGVASPNQTTPLQPMLVKDIRPDGDSNIRELTRVGEILYFTADDGIHGQELWRSDGTEAGTTIVKDIFPGSRDAWANGFINVGGILYFRARDGKHGTELWRSDGTSAGTFMVKDINPEGSSEPEELTSIGETIYFVAFEPTHGTELWKSDGTKRGTKLVKDLFDLGVFENLASLRGNVYFFAKEYYFATHDAHDTHGYALWKSDGTRSGTTIVKDINQGEESDWYGPPGDPHRITKVGTTLYFNAWKESIRYELWKSDGTKGGTVLVKDIGDSYGSSFPGGLTNVKGTLYFRVHGDDGYGGWSSSLWTSDGTSAGTVPLGISGGWIADLGGTVYLTGENPIGISDWELWKTDGTMQGTVIVKDINPGGSSGASWLVNVGDTLYFAADDGSSGAELWKSDGTEPGTVLLQDINFGSSSSSPELHTKVGPDLYFTADDGMHGRELWRLDP